MKRIYTDDELDYIKENYNSNKSWDEIADEMNKFNEVAKSAKQVRNKALTLGLKKDRKRNFNENYFDEIDSQDKAYWLGFIFADGYVVYNKETSNYELGIELSIVDKNHLELLNQCLDGDIEITTRTREKSYYEGHEFKTREIVSLRIFSKHMVKSLIQLGVVPNKTYLEDFPQVENDYMNSFLLGFYDGDGHIYHHKKSDSFVAGFTNPNKLFLNHIKGYMDKQIGIRSSNIYSEKEFKS